MRRLTLFLLALVIVGALLVPRLISKTASDSAPAAGGAGGGETRVLRVDVEEMVPERLVERLATTGTVRANEQVELVSEVSGKIEEILFEEGSRVEAGQVLVKLDASELLAEQERALHLLELAQRREARQHELLDDGVISEEEYENALSRRNVLRAELRLIEAQLVKTAIRAPFAGVVGLRRVSLGSYLSPQTRIATLQDVDAVKIDFSVPEKYAARMRVGGEISFSVKGDERTFRGEIYAIEPAVDAETRSLELRAKSPNPDGVLVPGAFADVELVVREIPDALTVPSIAVVPELGGKKIFVLEDGKARARQVRTGIRTDQRVQITDGLAAGERVIVSAIQQLRAELEVEAR